MLNIQDLTRGDFIKYQITYSTFKLEEAGEVIDIDFVNGYIIVFSFVGGRYIYADGDNWVSINIRCKRTFRMREVSALEFLLDEELTLILLEN